ncbi:MAG: ATPase [Magnetococcales bacterium]|nr:ATPase [Magnetococcales bacterium]
MFRPEWAHWFHLLVARADLPRTLALLASRQGIELETQGEENQTLLSDELVDYLAHFQRLSQQYRAFWPETDTDQFRLSDQELDTLQESPPKVLAAALAVLEQWRVEAEPFIQQWDQEKVRQVDLVLYGELARHLADHPRSAALDLAALQEDHGEWLCAALFVLPEPLVTQSAPVTPILCPVAGASHSFLLAVGLPVDMQQLTDQVVEAKGRALAIPPWAPGFATTVQVDIQLWLEKSAARMHRLHHALAEVYHRHDIPRHLRAVARLQWFFTAIEQVRPGPWLVHVSGWTDQADESHLNRLLQQAHLHALMDLSATPPAAEPPTLLVNPWWVKPFELFARLLGVPGQYEVDPSPLLVVLAPLLFGYMFGDVGQGLLLALIGLVWRKSLAISWLLITGGLSSVCFGLLFGSVFCREDILPALWLHPAQHPLPVLGVPLAWGVVILVTGVILDGIGHYWRGGLASWWLRQSGILLLYLGLIGWLLHPLGWMVAAVALGWYLVGNRLAGDDLLTLLGRLGHLLEVTMQLAVNTLSFARVGAFALAHAGLSQAVVTLAGLTDQAWAAFLVLLLGNLLVIVLEGLVVSVQTTRLILFEFFIRFLKGEGRPFRPLVPPPGWLFQA